jgi:hypothetical protein
MPALEPGDHRGILLEFLGREYVGITLAPMLLGIAFLFGVPAVSRGGCSRRRERSSFFAGIVAKMHIYFQPTSLFNTIVMLVMLVGGLALIAGSLSVHTVNQVG